MYFAHGGQAVESASDLPWELLAAQDKIQLWLSSYQNIGTSYGSMYNKLDYINRASKFACTMKSVKLSNEFLMFVKSRLAELSCKKKKKH